MVMPPRSLSMFSCSISTAICIPFNLFPEQVFRCGGAAPLYL
jgi:hypothetical protein